MDPGSAHPAERLKYVVYQRRMLADALKTKAMLYAMLGEGEKASGAAKEYFEVAFPLSKEDTEKARIKKEIALEQLEQMGPMRMRNGKLVNSPPGVPDGMSPAPRGFPS